MRKTILSIVFLLIFCLSFLILSCSKECSHEDQSHVITAPTCVTEGYTQYTCTCGYIYKGSFCPPTGHTLQESTVPSTCENEGSVSAICATCGYSEVKEVLSATGHELTPKITEATCTEAGYTLYSCSHCDFSYTDDPTTPTGHSMKITHALHPTPVEEGLVRQQCKSCDYNFTNYFLYGDLYTGAYVAQAKILAKGVDVSYWNNTPKNAAGTEYEPLNWEVIKTAGFDFAILRAGYTGTKDPVFEMNYVDAKTVGIDLGAYYYSYAKNEEQAIEEANELLGWLAGKQFEYPIYLDMESNTCLIHPDGLEETEEERKERLTSTCIAFIHTLREAGYYGALYSNNTWLTNHLDAEALKEYGELWYARYPKDPSKPQDMDDEEFRELLAASRIQPEHEAFVWNTQKYGNHVGLWQYTANGIIENSGMDQEVDFNYAFKDYPSLMKAYCLNGYQPNP